MSSQELRRFLDSVVHSHELATGLKPLTTHEQIIHYAQQQGFDSTDSDWINLYEEDFLSQSSAVQESIRLCEPGHWSWAFRQLSCWRAMLMEGAGDGRS